MTESDFAPILTIAIPTVSGREAQLEHLLTDCLFEQLRYTPEAIVLIEKDNKEMTIGAKRQLLLDNVTTPYFVMVDDDDTLAPDYVKEVLAAIEREQPDCIGYLESIIQQGQKEKLAIHSDRYREWGNGHDGYGYVRTIFYKDVIKTDIARQVGFDVTMRYGEDHDFARRLKASGLLIKEVFLPRIMYYYNAPNGSESHKERYGIK